MISVREVIVVEGRYDKNTLSQVVDATIMQTDGFGLFSDREKLGLLRALAKKRGIIVLTDSDSAGFLIRNHIKSAVSEGVVLHAYIPDIAGRERRKKSASKEGLLGVEGMRPEVIIEALRRAGATFGDNDGAVLQHKTITKADFYTLGLAGADSGARRAALKKKLGLPLRLTANGLLDVINVMYDRDEFIKLAENLPNE